MDRTGLLECTETRNVILGKLVTNGKENILFVFVGMTSVYVDNVVCLEATGPGSGSGPSIKCYLT